jgi:CRP/FNR family transcriptional regulator, dissimilatory nitrate respiration regulator
MKAEHVAVLLKTPLFSGIGKEEMASFLICLNPRVQEYAKGEFISMEGDALSGIGCILSGSASVLKESASGDRNFLTAIKPGHLFGEMAAWSQEKRWPATVQAEEETSALFIPPEKLAGPCAKSCRWHTAIIENMLKILSEKALMLNRKVDYLSMKSMRGKLSAYFLERRRLAGSSTFTMPLNRNELADYLGVSRPSMSREMGRMRDEGIIDYHLATVKIKNIDLIKQLAELQ